MLMRRLYRVTVGNVFTQIQNKMDHLRGLDFAREVQTDKDGIKYGAPSTIRVRHIVEGYFGNKITSNDSIIDIGCGKGKMLTFFYKYPFKKICGLEYVEEMVNIARNNLVQLHMGG